MSQLISPAFNFIVLVGLLYYFLKKPVTSMVFERHQEIKKSVEQARIHQEESERKYKEFQSKLAAFEIESKQMMESAKAQAEEMKQKILDEAKAMSERIIRDAEGVVESNLKDFKDQIRRENIEKATTMAEKLVREKISSDDQKRIVSEYVGKV